MTEPHPNLVHVDDVRPQTWDTAQLAATRWRLGTAAGARDIGLSRYRIPAGRRAFPLHQHLDEEELFYVVAGDGVLVERDGDVDRATRVGPGDCLVHPERGRPHTLFASTTDLEVLVFASGGATHLTYLPRVGATFASGLPLDGGPSAFDREDAAGPLEVPEPRPRPPHVVALADAEHVREDEPGYRGDEHKLSHGAGARRSGLRHVVLEAGELSCPPHWHTGEEECFLVLDGHGEALLGDDEPRAVRPGSLLLRPPASGVAHALRAGDGGLTYLAYGTQVPTDLCYYPRSRKLNAWGLLFRIEPLDYWDGER